MGFWRGLKRRLRAAIAPAVFLSLVAYFLWSATQGDRGLQAAAQRQADLASARAALAQAQADLAIWTKRVAGLRSDRLDQDALDERARVMTNVALPTDIIVPYGDGKRLF